VVRRQHEVVGDERARTADALAHHVNDGLIRHDTPIGGLKLQGAMLFLWVAAGFGCATWAVPHALASRATTSTPATRQISRLSYSKLDDFGLVAARSRAGVVDWGRVDPLQARAAQEPPPTLSWIRAARLRSPGRRFGCGALSYTGGRLPRRPGDAGYTSPS
jgi:hypothetical protein